MQIQPRSQGLSSYRPLLPGALALWGVKTGDLGNEFGADLVTWPQCDLFKYGPGMVFDVAGMLRRR